MIQQGGIVHDQSRPSLVRRSLELERVLWRERDNRNVRCCGLVPEARDDRADVGPGGLQVSQHQHRPFGFRARYQLAGAGEGLDAVVQILQPVHQLAAGHQLFVQDEHQWLNHALTVERTRANGKSFSTRPVCARTGGAPMRIEEGLEEEFGLDPHPPNFYRFP